MNVIIAPNAFKGSLTAFECARVISGELREKGITLLELPMCDGGDGTAAVVASYLHAEPFTVKTTDALGRAKSATCFIREDTAIIDLAEVCGLKDLKPQEYDVMNTSTAGLGTALCRIREKGIRKVLLGVGGSASIDAGLGALAKMGLNIVNSDRLYQNKLIDIESFEADHLIQNFNHIEFTVLCDVDNVIAGKQGAAYTFGKQKGASGLQVSLLDHQLKKYARTLSDFSGKDIGQMRHGGAAGGVAASFAALLDARLVSGADYCLEISSFHKAIQDAQWVITGEGKIDEQTGSGKVPGVIASVCRDHHVPVTAVAGVCENFPPGIFNRIISLSEYAGNPSESFSNPIPYLRLAAKNVKEELLKFI